MKFIARNPKLSVVEEIIEAESPTALWAKFSKNLAHIFIGFNKNIDGPKNCSKVFNNPTMNKVGIGKMLNFNI